MNFHRRYPHWLGVSLIIGLGAGAPLAYFFATTPTEQALCLAGGVAAVFALGYLISHKESK